MNIGHLCQEVLFIPHGPIMETGLPDSHLMTPLGMYPVRGTTLYELHRPFQTYSGRGCQQYMKVVGHDDKSVQQVSTFIAVMYGLIRDDIRGIEQAENRSVLPCLRSNKIRIARSGAAREPAHATSGAQAPSFNL
jgi:hypothetical protein